MRAPLELLKPRQEGWVAELSESKILLLPQLLDELSHLLFFLPHVLHCVANDLADAHCKQQLPAPVRRGEEHREGVAVEDQSLPAMQREDMRHQHGEDPKARTADHSTGLIWAHARQCAIGCLDPKR